VCDLVACAQFLNGDFEMIRVFASASSAAFPLVANTPRGQPADCGRLFHAAALNEGNPSLNLGDETVDSVEGAFRRVREVLLCASAPCALALPYVPRVC